jgi:hypothetical protein
MTGVGAIAMLLSLYALWSLFQHQAVCVRCNGRGKHRRGCPFDTHDEGRG